MVRRRKNNSFGRSETVAVRKADSSLNGLLDTPSYSAVSNIVYASFSADVSDAFLTDRPASRSPMDWLPVPGNDAAFTSSACAADCSLERNICAPDVSCWLRLSREGSDLLEDEDQAASDASRFPRHLRFVLVPLGRASYLRTSFTTIPSADIPEATSFGERRAIASTKPANATR